MPNQNPKNDALSSGAPLAERMRPATLKNLIGQEHITASGKLLRNALDGDRLFSMILWGPPGCGKTTLARILSTETLSRFIHFSAVLSGVKDIREVIREAESQLAKGKRTILFVDEIHRFNKAQQDAFLHHVESGLITLIGATTENPSFEVIPPLLSRCRVLTLKRLEKEDIVKILTRALEDPKKGLGMKNLSITSDALLFLAKSADGDARMALNNLEITARLLAPAEEDKRQGHTITIHVVEEALEKKALLYDKSGEEHYNLISAFHKSLRGSDPDAALYWLARMIASGEDALYIARRMVRFASEDVGCADPYALTISLNAMESFRFLGRPEGELALAQAAVYLATAPKSNAVYTAYGKAMSLARDFGALPVPMHIRNSPTKLMKNLGYGKGYKYAHDYKDGFVPQEHLPEELKKEMIYHPTERGYEKTIKSRLDKWRALKNKKEK